MKGSWKDHEQTPPRGSAVVRNDHGHQAMSQIPRLITGQTTRAPGLLARIGHGARLALAGVFAAIGLLGLLLPVIPGIVFLAAAAWLAGRSGTARRSRMARPQYEGLSPGERLRLRLLLVARAALNAVTRRQPG